MILFLSFTLFALWLICADATAGVLADLGSQPRSPWAFLWCLVCWPVLVPLLVYVWWTGD